MPIAPRVTMNPPRLLILEDEEWIAFSMKRYFLKRGFAVDCASELEEAEALVSNVRYDLVIADLRLTGVHGAEGLDMIGFVREHAPWTRTILLTAYGSPEVEAEARRRGVDAFVRKPRPLPDLAELALGLIESAESR